MNIDIKDAVLWIDVSCYECKKLVAYSNTIEYKGRKYCHFCDEKLRPLKGINNEKISNNIC